MLQSFGTEEKFGVFLRPETLCLCGDGLLHRYVIAFFRAGDFFLYVVNRMTPLSILRNSAAHDIEVHLPQVSRDFPDFAGSDGPMIDARDRADLRAGTAKEHLVGEVKLSAIDLTFLDFESKLVPK